jgi:hypothetical protein
MLWGEREENMESLMHVGNFVSKESNDNLKGIISSIMDKGFACHQPPEVLIKALEVVERAYHVDNICVSGCTFSGTAKTANKISSKK